MNRPCEIAGPKKNRVLLDQMLSQNPDRIRHLGDSQDIQATRRCVEA